MRPLVWLGLLAGAVAASPCFQEQPASAKPAINAEAIVNEWLKRLNALAEWTTGGPGDAVDHMTELYDPSVLLFVGPNENQIGPVTYSGMEGIRRWADNFAHLYSKSEFRVQVETSNVKTAGLLHTVQPPWGGLSIGVELGAYYTRRKDHRKFAAPGALFLEVNDSGKIRRAHIYLETDQTVEITP